MIGFRAAVLHVNTARAEATSPTMRIARFVASNCKIPLIHSPESAQCHLKTKFDVLFVKYGVLKFSSHRDEALQIYGNAKRIINLENDYSFKPDPRFKKANPSYECWGTIPRDVGLYLNWNVLTWNYPRQWLPAAPLRPADHPAYQDPALFYYGALRPGRVKAFQKYLDTRLNRVKVGCFPISGKKFKAMNPELEIVKFRDGDSVLRAEAAASLYLEDEHSHLEFGSLANRFYECMQAGVPLLIAEETIGTFKEAGYPMKEIKLFTVSGPEAVQEKLARAHSLAKRQRELWYTDFTQPVTDELIHAWDRLQLGLV